MMTKRLVYTKPDGVIAIIHPAPKARRQGESEDDFLARVLARNIEVGKQRPSPGRKAHEAGTYPREDDEIHVIEHNDIPTDKTFRDAWVIEKGKPTVEMGRAKEIQRNRLRAERKPMLAALDVEFVRALEAGGDTKAIAAEKQRLRDLPSDPRIDAAQTPDELKAIRASKGPG